MDPPEPDDLHRTLSGQHPVDWGDTLPTRTDLESRYGPIATRAALQRLAEIATVEPAVTADIRQAMPPGTTAHQLASRVKSPESLARKIDAKIASQAPHADSSVTDLLRYTMLTPDADNLVEKTRALVQRLESRGWTVQSALQSYVQGSRYRGIHAIMRTPHGADVEVQFHSAQSAEVKKATTRLYEIERGGDQGAMAREAARLECIRQSDQIPIPDHLDDLTELGGAPVVTMSFGKPHAPSPNRPPPTSDRARASSRAMPRTRETGPER